MRGCTRRALLAGALLLSGTLAVRVATAQQRRTIQGVVRDETSGETLPYARVAVMGTRVTTSTNTDGYFALLGLPNSAITVRVTYLGYAPLDTTIAPAADDLLIIEMTRLPIELDPLVVAESYRMIDIADGVSHLTASPRDLALLPSIGETDIFRSLQLLPGISGTNESSSGLFIRGGTPDQNLVLLDGMTVYHVDHFFGFFSAFNADAIKDVQVYKGGYPAQYGGRVAGVVELTGRTGDQNQLRAGVAGNLLSASAAMEIPLGGRGSILISGRRSYTDIIRSSVYQDIFDMFTGAEEPATAGPFAGRGGGGGGARGGQFANAQFATVQPDFYFYDLNGKITFRPSGRDVLSLSVYNGQDFLDESRVLNRELTFGTLPSRQQASDLTEFTDWGNHGVSGKWARQWNSRLYSNGLVAYSTYFSDFTRRTSLEVRDSQTDSILTSRSFGSVEDNRVGDLTLRLDNEWDVARGHKIMFGTWFTRSDVTYTFTRDDTTTILDRDQEATRAEAYVQDAWQIAAPLSLTIGARVSHYDQTDRYYVEPRFSLVYALTNRVRIKGAVGKYHQFVNRVVNENVTEGARDFWLLADGDLVDVQSSRHYVVGASYETGGLLLDAELYRQEFEGLNEFSLRFQRNRTVEPVNLFFAGSGVARGLELLAQRKLGRFTGWLSYTLAEVEHEFPGLNNGEPFPALQDQTHELKAVGSLNLGRWNLSATWALGSGRPYTAPESEYTIELLDGTQQSYIHVGEKNGLRLPAYHRLDLAAHYRLRIGNVDADFGLSVFNLYNRRNVWYRQFDLSESPVLITDVTYLGRTPNISIRFSY